eukprot:CAMPEP_0115452066 /NCGR_PEP_ID=MMETSP0271-20121206/42401_1 /TAXON_ID=71861 /ORGANISM="Scrippsiella trochoidea, Strain CCMP3099" /LENGTH=102 /DNA_ID=CAMNT_0002878379 /DNA_START=107 /DNA_END=415 /DNA_ORIENTATION=+
MRTKVPSKHGYGPEARACADTTHPVHGSFSGTCGRYMHSKITCLTSLPGLWRLCAHPPTPPLRWAPATPLRNAERARIHKERWHQDAQAKQGGHARKALASL